MENKSITKHAIVFIFMLGILTLVSSAILSYMSSNDKVEYQNTVEDAYIRIDALDNIQREISEAETSRRGYFITNDRQHLAEYYESKSSMDSSLKILRQFNGEQKNYDTLKYFISERYRIFAEGILLQQSKGNNSKIHNNIMERGRIAQSNLRYVLSKLKSEENKIVSQKNDLLEQSYTFANYTIIAGIGISSVLFIITFVILFNKSSKVFELESQEITKEELEGIVKERTAEISQINNKLNAKITSLENMEKALKQSEQYYRMLFEQAHDAIVIFSPEDETIFDANKRACEMYGFTKEEFTGLSMKKLHKNKPQGEENIGQILKDGNLFNFQQVHYRKDGSELLVEKNAALIMYKGKYAILSHNRDITDRVLKII